MRLDRRHVPQEGCCEHQSLLALLERTHDPEGRGTALGYPGPPRVDRVTTLPGWSAGREGIDPDGEQVFGKIGRVAFVWPSSSTISTTSLIFSTSPC